LFFIADIPSGYAVFASALAKSTTPAEKPCLLGLENRAESKQNYLTSN
jgi:hypothetical protein